MWPLVSYSDRCLGIHCDPSYSPIVNWIVIQKYFTSAKGLGFQHAHILGIYVCVCVYSNKKLIGNPKGMLSHICDSILINPLAKRSVLHTRGFESGTCWHKTSLMPNNTSDNWLSALVYTYTKTKYNINLKYILWCVYKYNLID